MANLNTLFDFSKFEKIKPADQKKFEHTNESLLIDFKNSVHVAFKNLHTKVLSVIEPIDQDKNLRADIMSGFLAGHMKRNYPHYCYKATPQRFRLYIDGVSIYLKKLDENTKLPSNIPTDQSIQIHNQLARSTAEADPKVFLGYTVNDVWSMITGIFAVCIDGEEVLWKSDLTNFGEMDQTPVITMPPNPITPKVKEGAQRKKKQNE